MNRIYNVLFILTVLLAFSCEKAEQKKGIAGDVKIVWEEPKAVKYGKYTVTGGYPRVHRLNDGRLMLSYSTDNNAVAQFSTNDGETWGAPKKIMEYYDVERKPWGKARMTAAVPDFAQLSKEHPKHPDRIIYACNYRPRELTDKGTLGEKGWTTVAAYTISISISDDNGKTWTDKTHVYKSGIWDKNAKVGCWEPFVLELPDGTVQIYFADETPYYGGTDSNKRNWHNISVIESRDGGDTWGQVRIVSQNSECRDGMPVVTIHNDMLLLAIESTDFKGQRLHPIVINNPITNNWSSIVGKGDPHRFEPFQVSLGSRIKYSGSPYIITTDNYIVYSYQISDWYTPPANLEPSQQLALCKQYNEEEHATLEVQVCPKTEVNDNGYFRTMRSPSRPLKVDQTTGKQNALWNSLCDLGDDKVMVISQYNGKVYTVKGTVVKK